MKRHEGKVDYDLDGLPDYLFTNCGKKIPISDEMDTTEKCKKCYPKKKKKRK